MDEFRQHINKISSFLCTNKLPNELPDNIKKIFDELTKMSDLYRIKCEGDEARKCNLIKKLLKRIDHYDSLLYTKAVEVWKDKTFDEVEEFYDSLCEIL